MRIETLEVFITLARTRSISETARRQFLTQPAVSGILSSLEKQLGYQLFEREMRQKKPLAITEEGKIFLRFAEQTIDGFYNTKLELALPKKRIATVSIGSGPSYSVKLLPTIERRFKEKYPLQPITIKTYPNTYYSINRLLANECDISLAAFIPSEPDLIAHKAFDDPICLICPSVMGLDNEISLRQLKTLPLIMREQGSVSYEQTAKALRQAGVPMEELNIVMTVYENLSVKQAVSMGTGCGFVARSLVNSNALYPDCKIVKVKNLSIARSVYLIRRNISKPADGVKLLWSFISTFDWQKEGYC